MSKALRILTINNPEDERILRQPSADISKENIKSPKFQEFLDNMLHTAKTSKEQTGYDSSGLAAVQVGENIRVFYIMNLETNEYDLYINPQMDILKPTKVIDTEACLSVPNRDGKVARYTDIRVRYLDREGNKQKKKLYDWEAREFQHEYDHLDGVLYIDKLTD